MWSPLSAAPPLRSARACRHDGPTGRSLARGHDLPVSLLCWSHLSSRTSAKIASRIGVPLLPRASRDPLRGQLSAHKELSRRASQDPFPPIYPPSIRALPSDHSQLRPPLLRPWRKQLPPPSFLAVSAVVNAGLAPGVPRDRGGRVSGGIKCVGGRTVPQFLNIDAPPPCFRRVPRLCSTIVPFW
jgi:hypothetical protein